MIIKCYWRSDSSTGAELQIFDSFTSKSCCLSPLFTFEQFCLDDFPCKCNQTAATNPPRRISFLWSFLFPYLRRKVPFNWKEHLCIVAWVEKSHGKAA